MLQIAPPVPPTPPTAAELKAQKKRDRFTLNQLKIILGDLMNALKIKPGPFRRPPIDPEKYRYLFDEQDQTMFSTDLPIQQRQTQEQHRPYELSTDSKGVEGICEVATDKFYYNLEIVTIERRFVNGYYKRAKDFLADIKRLWKDAHTLGDQDRITKADIMLTNMDVDIQTIEARIPDIVAQWEAVYRREMEREAGEVEKARKAREEGREVPRINSNVPPPDSNTTTEISGPIVLGPPMPGHPTVPQFPRSSMSNGYTFSNSDPARLEFDADAEMSNTDLRAIMPPPPDSDPNASRVTQSTQQQRIQRAAMTPMAHGSQAMDYYNSASTTTSGKKTGSGDHPSGSRSNGTQHSGETSNGTQNSNGIHPAGGYPQFPVAAAPGGSQLPDTQGM